MVLFALCISFVLSILPSARDRARTNAGAPSRLISSASIILALCAVSLGITAVVLSFTADISVDALAAVVFGLAPALVAMPFDAIQYAFIRAFDLPGSVLRQSSDDFRYARIGDRCGSSPNAKLWYPLKGSLCRATPCNALMYVRNFPSKYYNPLFLLNTCGGVQAHRIPRKVVSERLLQWRGERIAHTGHVVMLRDYDSGPEVRWWRLISSGVWLISRPWIVHIDSQAQMLQALELLADIVAIGRLILHFERDFVYEQLKSEPVRKAITGTAGTICNAILVELNLQEWGCFDDSLVTALAQDHFDLKENLAREYGLLFLLLTVKSNIFGGRLPEPERQMISLELLDPGMSTANASGFEQDSEGRKTAAGQSTVGKSYGGRPEANKNAETIRDGRDGQASSPYLEYENDIEEWKEKETAVECTTPWTALKLFLDWINVWRRMIEWLHRVKGFEKRLSGQDVIKKLVRYDCVRCSNKSRLREWNPRSFFSGSTSNLMSSSEGSEKGRKKLKKHEKEEDLEQFHREHETTQCGQNGFLEYTANLVMEWLRAWGCPSVELVDPGGSEKKYVAIPENAILRVPSVSPFPMRTMKDIRLNLSMVTNDDHGSIPTSNLRPETNSGRAVPPSPSTPRLRKLST